MYLYRYSWKYDNKYSIESVIGERSLRSHHQRRLIDPRMPMHILTRVQRKLLAPIWFCLGGATINLRQLCDVNSLLVSPHSSILSIYHQAYIPRLNRRDFLSISRSISLHHVLSRIYLRPCLHPSIMPHGPWI